MKSQKKSKLIALMMAALVMNAALPVRSAHAVLGLLALPVPISFAFLAAGAGGLIGANGLADASRQAREAGEDRRASLLRFSAGLAFLSGALLLDASDEANATLEFGSLSNEGAKHLGLTADEHAAFERERLEINLLREETIVRGQKLVEKTPEISFEQLTQSMSKDWQELSAGTLSKESISAVKKISAAGISKL
jgi:hypothetical protein